MVEGFQHTEIGIIPNDWEVTLLGSVAAITKLAGFEYSKYFNSYKDGGDIIVIRGTNITHDKLDLSDVKTIPSATSKTLQRSKLFKGDLVFAYVGTIGPIYLVEEDNRFHLGPNTSKITLDKAVDTYYIFNYFKSWLIRNEIFEHTSIGAQPSLSMTKIRKFRIILPPTKAEQTAIATALNDADALIQQIEQLIAKKRNIKTGAMQELLKPKAGWEVKKLGEVLKVRHGKSQKEVVSKNGSYPILASGGVIGRAKSFLYDKPSVLIGRKGTIDQPQFMDTPFWSVDTLFYTEIAEDYDVKFIFYMFNLIDWYAYNEGSGVPSLNAKTIELIEKYFPKTKPEQTHIAQILSDMDKEIQQLETQFEKYKMMKQGMMQSLLTGKIRLV